MMSSSLPDPEFAAKLRDVSIRCQRAIDSHLAEARPLLARIGVPKDEALHMLLLLGSLVSDSGQTTSPAVAAPVRAETPKPKRGGRRPRRAKATKAAPTLADTIKAKVGEQLNARKPAGKRGRRGGVKKGTLMPGSKMNQAVKFASGRQAFKVDEIVSALGISRDDAHKLLSQGRKAGRFTKVSEGTWRGVLS